MRAIDRAVVFGRARRPTPDPAAPDRSLGSRAFDRRADRAMRLEGTLEGPDRIQSRKHARQPDDGDDEDGVTDPFEPLFTRTSPSLSPPVRHPPRSGPTLSARWGLVGGARGSDDVPSEKSAPAPPLRSRWGPGGGWGTGNGLLSRRGDYHCDAAPRRTSKRRVGEGYSDDDGEEDGVAEHGLGGPAEESWSVGHDHGVDMDAHDQIPVIAREGGLKCTRFKRCMTDRAGFRPQLMSACMLEQSGQPDLAVAEVHQLVSSGGQADSTEAAVHATQCEDRGAVVVADRLVRWGLRCNLFRVPSDAPDWVELAEHCIATRRLHCANAVLSELAQHAVLSPTVCGVYERFEIEVGATPSPPADAPRMSDSDGVLVYLGASAVEWRAENVEKSAAILEHGIEQYPHAAKLWYALGTLRRHTEGRAAALATYQQGLAACPSSGTLRRLVSTPLECAVATEAEVESDGMNVDLGCSDPCYL
eukprot:m.84850 g.84850  ORF g.84850 m.84850 type:complete len:475 (-) comp11333_c0_seq1:1321-2745(-)